MGNRPAACRSSGMGVPGRQPTAFPPVTVFQRNTPSEGSVTTDAANRIPSRTACPRTGTLPSRVDHREDERLPFVRGVDVVGYRGIVIDAVPFLEDVGEVPECNRHLPGEHVEELFAVVGTTDRVGVGERPQPYEERLHLPPRFPGTEGLVGVCGLPSILEPDAGNGGAVFLPDDGEFPLLPPP